MKTEEKQIVSTVADKLEVINHELKEITILTSTKKAKLISELAYCTGLLNGMRWVNSLSAPEGHVERGE
jgi:hypothetical protein